MKAKDVRVGDRIERPEGIFEVVHLIDQPNWRCVRFFDASNRGISYGWSVDLNVIRPPHIPSRENT
jgi:cupin superfamily acireductone dioxygenase involved in methionine salvage